MGSVANIARSQLRLIDSLSFCRQGTNSSWRAGEKPPKNNFVISSVTGFTKCQQNAPNLFPVDLKYSDKIVRFCRLDETQ